MRIRRVGRFIFAYFLCDYLRLVVLAAFRGGGGLPRPMGPLAKTTDKRPIQRRIGKKKNNKIIYLSILSFLIFLSVRFTDSPQALVSG